MENEYTAVMSERTEEELKVILTTERDQYKPEALNAAELELKKRGIDSSAIKKEHEELQQEKKKEKIRLIKPNIQRAKIAQNMIWLVLIIELVSIYSSYLQYDLLKSIQNGKIISDQVANTNDSREMIIGFIYLVIYVISGVTFIQWFRRAYYNLNNRIKCKHSEGWAAGSWFVPIISLYRPYQIMKEMSIETTSLLKEKTNSHVDSKTELIGWWWALWIASSWAGNYIMRISFKAETLENYINSTLGNIFLSFLGIPLAIITVKMIKTYSEKEEQLAE